MNVVVANFPVESAVRVLDWLSAWAWRASWEGAALAGIVAIILWLLGRRIAPAWRFALWGLVLIRLAMPAMVGVNWKWLMATKPTTPVGFFEALMAPRSLIRLTISLTCKGSPLASFNTCSTA